jgi:hypothetical protein
MALVLADVIAGNNVLGSSFLPVPTQSLPFRANKSRAYAELSINTYKSMNVFIKLFVMLVPEQRLGLEKEFEPFY